MENGSRLIIAVLVVTSLGFAYSLGRQQGLQEARDDIATPSHHVFEAASEIEPVEFASTGVDPAAGDDTAEADADAAPRRHAAAKQNCPTPPAPDGQPHRHD